MDLWQRARVFAEEATKRSQEISKEAAKRSQELTKGAAKFSQEFVSETAKKSKELAAEASKKADLIKNEALRRADQIKTLAGEIPLPISPMAHGSVAPEPTQDLETYGVTEELREFVKGITTSTFRDFPMEDEPEISDVPTVSNVRQDLSEWQATHATLVLSTVDEISQLRYGLCPRFMKERQFWRIYFLLVHSFVVPYEKQYESSKLKSIEHEQSVNVSENSTPVPASKIEAKDIKLQSKTSTSSNTEHDLDAFLLGDLGSGDEGPDDGDDGFDDDFDKIGSNSGLESEDDNEGKSKQSSK